MATAASAAPPATAPPARAGISADAVCKRYGARWALTRVGFDLAAGETAMLAGRNGAGKSTLLRILATALRPDLGSVRIDGLDTVFDRDALRRRVALLDHRSHLYDALSAAENLAILARFLRADGIATDAGAPEAALHEVGLAERADDAVAGFSAGMRKRLALARVLLKRPQVALLDEPYGELDPPGFRLVDGVLDRLKRRGATIVMSTHLVERGREHCDRALVLEGGRVAWYGAARQMPADAGTL
jgi:heme exporter protein A